MLIRCQKCQRMYEPEEDEEGFINTKLCYDCFEASVEEHEERKRERIARENEY
jgi:hypothetical protein